MTAAIKYFLLNGLCLFLIMAQLSAQNTLVMGTLKNAKSVKHIELKVNNQYINNEIRSYASNIIADQSFAFAVQIDEPQLVTLHYAYNKALIYLEPNDTLYIDGDASSFQYSLKFSGRSGANNTLYAQYLRNFPQETDPFKQLQYKQGTYWYTVSPPMDKLMSDWAKEDYTARMDERKSKANALLKFHVSEEPKLTAEFIAFMETEIQYDWAYHMFLYGNIYRKKHGLDSTFLAFTTKLPFESDQLGNYWYRQYTKAFMSYQFLMSKESSNPIVGQYKLSPKYLGGKLLAYYQSEMVAKGIRKKQFDDILPLYWSYLDENPYTEFDEKLTSTYEKAIKYTVGQPAPPFTLKDTSGTTIALSSFKGKVVYLNFWASWCRPCLRKMAEMQPIIADLESQGIVFLNVSLDRDKSIWQANITERNFSGTHVLAPEHIDDQVAKIYEVKAIPQFFIIDKSGNFAEKPKLKGNAELRTTLSRLNNNY